MTARLPRINEIRAVIDRAYSRFRKTTFLSGADGVISKFQQNKVRYAHIDEEGSTKLAGKSRELLAARARGKLAQVFNAWSEAQENRRPAPERMTC